MHDFVSYLFYLLQRGMRFAVPAALICGLILAVCYAVCRKKGRRFPWGKAVCALLLVGWAAVTVFVTLLRSEPKEFAAAHGVEFPDAYYYDDLVIYANHSSGDFLNVTLHDGTWEYSFGRDHTPVFDAPASGVTEDMLRETLDKFGFSIPADAAFTLSPYGETSYRAVFSADLLPTEGGFLHGTLTCDLRTQGDGQSTLSQLENRITTLAPVREEPILSPAQALAALQSGKSFEGAWFAQSVQQIEVRSSTLDYLSDSKGFYQPVYRFELSLAGQAGGITDAVDYVPALF